MPSLVLDLDPIKEKKPKCTDNVCLTIKVYAKFDVRFGPKKVAEVYR